MMTDLIEGGGAGGVETRGVMEEEDQDRKGQRSRSLLTAAITGHVLAVGAIYLDWNEYGGVIIPKDVLEYVLTFGMVVSLLKVVDTSILWIGKWNNVDVGMKGVTVALLFMIWNLLFPICGFFAWRLAMEGMGYCREQDDSFCNSVRQLAISSGQQILSKLTRIYQNTNFIPPVMILTVSTVVIMYSIWFRMKRLSSTSYEDTSAPLALARSNKVVCSSCGHPATPNDDNLDDDSDDLFILVDRRNLAQSGRPETPETIPIVLEAPRRSVRLLSKTNERRTRSSLKYNNM